jgi:glycosyltransferase involved in cell wall biosynthesis
LRTACDKIIINNKIQVKELQQLGFNKNKINVIGAGIDYELISNLPILQNTKSYDCVYVGRINYTKGVFDLVPIWKKVIEIKPNATLAIIGEGTDKVRNQLQKQLEIHKLQNNISLIGYKTGQALYSLMKKAKIFLFTDHEAGWGVAVAEAMACGLPVVCYENDIFGSVYSKGFIKVPFKNYDYFSKQVLILLNNKLKKMKLAKEANMQASKLDWKYAGEKFASILTQIR